MFLWLSHARWNMGLAVPPAQPFQLSSSGEAWHAGDLYNS